MKITIINNNLHSPSYRKNPLINSSDEELILDELFITDVGYSKYLLPVIKVVDKVRLYKNIYKIIKKELNEQLWT